MNGFIFASGVNNPKFGKADSVHAFQPGARAFKKIHGIPQDIFYFDWQEKDAVLRQKILNKIRTIPVDDNDGLDVVAYFGHGIQHGLPSAGFYSTDHSGKPTGQVQELASAIASVSKNEVRVVLYACSAGALPTSFAGALATALNSSNAAVFGHTISGHTFGNPYVTVFTSSHVGRYVVAPGSKNWHAWAKAIRAGNANDPTKHPLWAKFPFMSEDEIRAELGDFVPGGVCAPVGRW
jgi:hypothetical protein